MSGSLTARLIGRLLAAVVTAVVAGCGGGPPLSAPLPPNPPATVPVAVPTRGHVAVSTLPPTELPTPAHVVVLVLENQDADAVIGSSQAPYLTSLAARGALFTDAHAVTHPSQPNYLALFAGDTFDVTDDHCPLAVTGTNLAELLTEHGRSFTAYSEDLPTTGFAGCRRGGYARKHAPWADFASVPGTMNRPFSDFDPSDPRLPTVAFLVPNLCHDMHDCDVATGDAWVRQHLDGYLGWAQTSDSLLVITWDEADRSASNQIPTLFVGPMVKPGRYSERVDHYRVLRTIEDMYRLPHAGHSQSVAPITDTWLP